MRVVELSKILPNYEDVDETLLQPMVYEHQDIFDIYKIEKDFLLTIILIYLGEHNPELIFKGGTCLNKIYFEYYRLSEDLDFVFISKRGSSARHTIFKKYRKLFEQDVFKKMGLTFESWYTYGNNTQLSILLSYKSLIDSSNQTIKIDIRIEKELLRNSIEMPIGAIFKDPRTGGDFFRHHTINVMDLDEMMSEKTRAALTRLAIRDFFDVRYAKNYKKFDFSTIGDLISTKVGKTICIIENSYDGLENQLNSMLYPVLTKEHRESFDLKEIYDFILTLKPENA